jgi:hypothetical protein
MTIEVNGHDARTTNYLIDRLKQHLATFEVPTTQGTDEKHMTRENTINKQTNHSFLEH